MEEEEERLDSTGLAAGDPSTPRLLELQEQVQVESQVHLHLQE